MTISPAAIEAGAVEKLRARFRGALLRPGEEGYDEARRIWNGEIDRRPALIARCAGADDVVEAVRFARERDRYDPGNFFRMNANIAPSAGAAGSTARQWR